MEQKYILWDQDNFMLRGRYDCPSDITVNPTVRAVLEELKQKGYTNLILSNKSAIISKEKARMVGLEDLFDDFFDARGLINCKSTAGVQLKYGLSAEEIADKAIYFGDSFENDLIYDTDSLVQVFDSSAMMHDFRIFSWIIDFLNEKNNGSFKKSYERLSEELLEVKGIRMRRQKLNLSHLLSQRENKADYEGQVVQETSYVIRVEAVEQMLCTAPVLPKLREG